MGSFRINGREIGGDNSCFIIAELSANHGGDIEIAKETIRAAKRTGGDFLNQNIKLFYHDFEHPLYMQVDNNFIPYLGIFDLIFNCGFDEALKKIRFGRKPNLNYDFL